MARPIPRLALSTVLAASACLSVAAPAQAAARPCVVGEWKLAGLASKTIGYVEFQSQSKGLKGTRLTVTKSSLSYDFTRSKKLVTTGVDSGKPIEEWSKYDKRLKVKAAFKGGGKGRLSLKTKTASGKATLTRSNAPGRRVGLAGLIRKKTWDPIVLKQASYTCTAETLTFRLSKSWYSGEYQFHSTVRYTRL
ncbi:hypothetical protein [Actinocorallia aurantiaca]|uniref:Uncharacterized protein n=1 Tax=Actinocorallia aurantiaca TaxID=46204 RepID=A0ABN3U1I1_9ACTN